MLVWHERQSEKLAAVGTKAMVPAVGRLQTGLQHRPEDSLRPVKVAASNLDTWQHAHYIISYMTYIHTYICMVNLKCSLPFWTAQLLNRRSFPQQSTARGQL